MSKVRALSLAVVLSCFVPAVAMAMDCSGGVGGNFYVDRCEVPTPDWYEFHNHFASHDWYTKSEAINLCRDFLSNLPFHWSDANFTVHFPLDPVNGEWRSFTCQACVRYENGAGPWAGHPDMFVGLAQPIEDSIAGAVAHFGGRVSRVEFFASSVEETGELAGGYQVTLVNDGTGQTGVVRIDPFTGEATVIREESICEEP